MKLIRNKFIIGLLCIAIGITAGFVLLPKSLRREIAMTQVVRLKQDVKAGDRLTEDLMELASLPSESVPAGAGSAVEAFAGKYAALPLFAGDILTNFKIRDTLVDPVAAGAAKGKQLVSLTIPTLTAGVSGALKPGDVVAVMVTRKLTQFSHSMGLLTAPEPVATTTETAPESGEDETAQTDEPAIQTLISSIQKETETVIPEALRYLEVCKVTASDGTDALVNPAKDPDIPNRLPATVTFYVTEEQALKLAEIEQDGDIHIAFLARGEAADVFIPRDERVLVEEPLPTPTPEPAATPEPTATPEPGQAAEAPVTSQSPETTVEPAVTREPADPADIDFNDPGVGE